MLFVQTVYVSYLRSIPRNRNRYHTHTQSPHWSYSPHAPHHAQNDILNVGHWRLNCVRAFCPSKNTTSYTDTHKVFLGTWMYRFALSLFNRIFVRTNLVEHIEWQLIEMPNSKRIFQCKFDECDALLKWATRDRLWSFILPLYSTWFDYMEWCMVSKVR